MAGCEQTKRCPTCWGAGWLPGCNKCHRCGGSGQVPIDEGGLGEGPLGCGLLVQIFLDAVLVFGMIRYTDYLFTPEHSWMVMLGVTIVVVPAIYLMSRLGLEWEKNSKKDDN